MPLDTNDGGLERTTLTLSHCGASPNERTNERTKRKHLECLVVPACDIGRRKYAVPCRAESQRQTAQSEQQKEDRVQRHRSGCCTVDAVNASMRMNASRGPSPLSRVRPPLSTMIQLHTLDTSEGVPDGDITRPFDLPNGPPQMA